MSQIRTDSIVPSGGVPSGADGGGIIQVVQAVKTDTFFANGNGGTQAVTGLSASITPRKTSNKILVAVTLNACSNNNQSGILIYRNGSVTLISDIATSYLTTIVRFQVTQSRYERYNSDSK